jgi:hypothetical protein
MICWVLQWHFTRAAQAYAAESAGRIQRRAPPTKLYRPVRLFGKKMAKRYLAGRSLT